jgi:hypothetical protein
MSEPGNNETRVSNETGRPEHVYINLEPRFTSVVLTVPRLDVDLPENPNAEPLPENTVIVLKNNGRYKLASSPKNYAYNGLDVDSTDYDKNPTIESIDWNGETFTGEEILAKRQELLEKFFRQVLGSEENVQGVRSENEAAGLKRGSYLYRAIDKYDWRKLIKEKTKVYSHLDPSANFESEEMFQREHSQVKYYAGKTEEGYSGHIIRWKIEDPVLYRRAGMQALRVVPLFSHFLPSEIEVSEDRGETFKPLVSFSSKS